MAIVHIGELHAENRNINQLLIEATTGSSNPTIDTEPRTGSYSYQFNGTRRPGGLGFSAVSQFWAGVWLKHRGVSDLASNEVSILRFSGTPTRYIHYIYPTNILRMGVNGNTVDIDAYDTGFMRQMTWMYLGIHFKADASTGFFSFYLDGKKVLTFTGDTTGNVSACYFGGVPAASQGWIQAWFDDFYVQSTVGEVDSCPPPKRFLFSLPNAAGNDTEWTPTGAVSNFQAVDEAPPDDDTSYVEAASTALTDTYNLASFTLPAQWENIPSVSSYAWAKETNGAAEIDLHLYDGSYAVGSSKALETSYAAYGDRHTTRPSGGDWDAGSIDTIQMGYERTL